MHQIVEVAGVADSARAFARQSGAPGLALALKALGPHLEVPLLSSQPEADLLARLRRGDAFPSAGPMALLPDSRTPRDGRQGTVARRRGRRSALEG